MRKKKTIPSGPWRVLIVWGWMGGLVLGGRMDARAQTSPTATMEAPRPIHLFVSGFEGHHTYRVPALVRANSGTLLAFCEGRTHSAADEGDNDICLKRSFDDGLTWKPLQIVADDGKQSLHDPCAVVDRTNGIIWLFYKMNRLDTRVFVVQSRDDGATWSERVDVSESVRPKGGYVHDGFGNECGHGIQLTNGWLVVPGRLRKSGFQGAYVIISQDHGVTWSPGGLAQDGSSESELVQTADGGLYMNARNYGDARGRRLWARSANNGLSFARTGRHADLPEPSNMGCMGSVVRWSREGPQDRNRLAFSNPASDVGETDEELRRNLTVRLSYDEGATWTAGKTLHPGPSAYSDLCVTSDQALACLYEHGEETLYESLVFVRFDLEWVTDGADRWGAPAGEKATP